MRGESLSPRPPQESAAMTFQHIRDAAFIAAIASCIAANAIAGAVQ